jgi:hypothetical protein
MATIDAATLAKFQKFQALLAQSPEIVEALNSPEILALAAMATKPQPEPKPAPEPDYPVVGYGVSDDVSVLSEMTTPTVMTRQTVEEDEFYPEIDGTGLSSSGLGSGPRRIGLKIGVSAFESGRLPPPPPKSKTRNDHKMRHGRAMPRKTKGMAPMSKIVEVDASVTTAESTESNIIQTSPLITKKSTWNSQMLRSGSAEKIEPHPFLGRDGPGTVRRHNSSNSRTRRSNAKKRGVNRNRSMPTNMKVNSSSNASSDSLYEDDITKSSGESNLSPSASGSSDTSSGSSSPSTATNEKLASEAAQSPTQRSNDVDKVKKSRGRSVPRMRLVQTNRAEENESETRSRSLSKKAHEVFEEKDVDNRRSSAIEEKTTNVKNSPRDDDRDEKDSESSNTKVEDSKVRTPVIRRWKPPSTDNAAIPPAFRSSNHSKGSRGSTDNAAIPPAFRSSNHSKGSRGRTSRLPVSSDHLKAKDASKSDPRPSKTFGARVYSNHSKSEEQNETSSEDHTETPTSTDDESDEDYVRKTVRKPGKAAMRGDVNKISICRPAPSQFKQYLSEITQVIHSENSVRPSDYLPSSGSPFAAARKKKVQLMKKKFNNPSDGIRSGEWLGSGKVQKCSWKAK